jgi:AraC family transcriptional regulator, transcriptional activator of pobA
MEKDTKYQNVPTFKLFRGSQEWPIKELVHHEFIQQRCAETEGRIITHRHLDLFHVMYLYNGSAKAVLDGNEFRIHAPLLVTVPPMCIHGFTPTETIHGHLLTIPGSSMSHLLSYEETYTEFAEQPKIIRGDGIGKWPDLDQMFRELAREYTHDNPSRYIAIQSILRLIFVWAIRHQSSSVAGLDVSSSDRDATRIRKFKKLIEINYKTGLSIKEYASQMGLSSAQLNNICRSKVSQSALQIVHERVTLEAKRYLIYTSLTISEVAYELGFADPAYFTRFFSKQVGEPPKQYRINHRPDRATSGPPSYAHEVSHPARQAPQ